MLTSIDPVFLSFFMVLGFMGVVVISMLLYRLYESGRPSHRKH